MSDDVNIKQQKLDAILELAKGDQDVAESAVVRLSDPYVTMFGKQFNDKLTNNVRSSMQVHPYPWFAAGSTGIVAYQDFNKNIEIAFINKHGKDENKYYLPGGFASAGFLKDGQIGLGPLTHDQMDEAEVGILQGHRHSYMEVANKYGIDKFTMNWQSPMVDISLRDCVIRELKEEIGLYDIETKELEFAMHEGIYLPYPLPVLVNTYLVDYGKMKPVLVPDNIEVSKAFWVPIKNVKVVEQENGSWRAYHAGVSIDFQLIKQVNAAIIKLREKDFELGNRNAVLGLINKAGLSIKIPAPEHPWEFGEKAYLLHLKLIELEQQALNALSSVACQSNMMFFSYDSTMDKFSMNPDSVKEIKSLKIKENVLCRQKSLSINQ